MFQYFLHYYILHPHNIGNIHIFHFHDLYIVMHRHMWIHPNRIQKVSIHNRRHMLHTRLYHLVFLLQDMVEESRGSDSLGDMISNLHLIRTFHFHILDHIVHNH